MCLCIASSVTGYLNTWLSIRLCNENEVVGKWADWVAQA